MPVKEAKGCNQTVNRLPDSPPSLAQVPEMDGGRDGQVLATRVKDLELAKFTQDSFERALISNALKNLTENQIRQPEALSPKLTIKIFGLGIPQATEIVDEHCGINDHHLSLLRIPAKTRFVQVAVPSDFALEAPKTDLPVSLNEQPQPGFHCGTLCPRPATPHGSLNQAIVDIDVGAHLSLSRV